MAIRAASTDKRKTHDISLTDGTTTIGLTLCNFRGQHDPNAIKQVGNPRTALQIRQGQAEYSDFEMPYTPIIQNDWSGGFGNKYLDKDKSKFRMSYRMDTTQPNKMFLGPKENVISGIVQSQARVDPFTHSINYYYPQAAAYPNTDLKDYTWIRFPFTTTRAYTTPIFRFIGCTYSKACDYKFSIYSDVAGAPDTELYTETQSLTTNDTRGNTLRFHATINLTTATTYWITMRMDTDPTVLDGTAAARLAGWATFGVGYTHDFQYTDTATLPATGFTTVANTGISYSIIDPSDVGGQKFFEYRRSLYMVTRPDNDSAPRLFREGYHGLAAANTGALSLLKTGLTLALNELAGAIAFVVAGSGSQEAQNWRKIVSNTTSGDVTVSPPWNIVHSATTEYAIIGTTAMHEITGHGLTKPVTDVLVSDSVIYFAQGDATNIRRMREYDNSGTWTRQYADDGTNKATFLERGPKATGGDIIWRANNNPPSISMSDVKAWGTDLSFGTAITCGDSFNKITNLIFYGNPLIPWVLKENEIGSVSDAVYARVPIGELAAVKSEKNGIAAIHFGVYLYFSMLDGIERYYDGRLDDIGPNRDEGMYARFKGNISSMVSYPGRIYAAIDCANETGKISSILCYNQLGYHHIYGIGERSIRDLYIQTIPAHMDRLWFAEEGEPIYLQIAMDPLKEDEYQNVTRAWIDLSTITAGFRDINKYYRGMSAYHRAGAMYWAQYIYRNTGSPGDENPQLTYLCEFNYATESSFFLTTQTGKELNLRMDFADGDIYTYPPIVLEAIRVDAVTRIPVKRSWSIMFRVQTRETDLNGDPSTFTAKQIYDKLEEWANSDVTPAPITLASNHDIFDARTVFIDPASVQPLRMLTMPNAEKENETMYIGQLSVYEA